MAENTFDGERSGLNKFDILKTNNDQTTESIATKNLTWKETSWEVLAGLKPGTSFTLLVIAFGCETEDTQRTESFVAKTQPIECASIKLEEKQNTNPKRGEDEYFFSITESLKNIQYGIPNLDFRYTIGEHKMDARKLFTDVPVEEQTYNCIKRTKTDVNQTCHIALKMSKPNEPIQVIIVNGMADPCLFILSPHTTNLLLSVSLLIVFILFILMIILIAYLIIFYNKGGRLPNVFQKVIKNQPVPPDFLAMPTINPRRQPIQRGAAQFSMSADANNCKPMTWNEITNLVEKDDNFTAIVLEEYERLSEAVKKQIVTRQTTTEANKWLPSRQGDPNPPPKMNRYGNILAYDNTRVILTKPRQGCDYINANWIRGFNGPNEFIATQGPLASTVPHFWQMILENNVQLIVMLTKLSEVSKAGAAPTLKCDKYWPATNNDRVYHDIKVENLEQERIAEPVGTVKRTFLVSWVSPEVRQPLVSQPLRVTQIHYTGWPDYGAPSKTQDLLQLHSLMRKEQSKIQGEKTYSLSSPVVVHCSAGVGRTGTVIGLDTIANAIDYNNPKLDIYGVVYNMRKDRCFMVQKSVQYKYLYQCVAEYIKTQTSNPLYQNEVNFDEQYIYEDDDDDDL